MTLHFPREHGATVQLSAALLGALLLGSPGFASIALILAAVFAFWAHEPLAVALGHRGDRLRDLHRPSAARLSIGLGAVAAACLALGALFMPEGRLTSLHPPIVLGAFAHIAFAARKERTTGGELFAGVAIASWAVPVAVSGGVEPWVAVQAWLAFSASFVVAALAVRAVIVSAKPRQSTTLRLSAVFAAILLVAVLLGLGVARRLHPSVGLAVAPAALFALVLASSPPHPKHLKRIGWGLTGASAFSVVTLVVGLGKWGQA